MPFTPFHLGPALLFGLAFSSTFDLLTLLIASYSRRRTLFHSSVRSLLAFSWLFPFLYRLIHTCCFGGCCCLSAYGHTNQCHAEVSSVAEILFQKDSIHIFCWCLFPYVSGFASLPPNESSLSLTRQRVCWYNAYLHCICGRLWILQRIIHFGHHLIHLYKIRKGTTVLG